MRVLMMIATMSLVFAAPAFAGERTPGAQSRPQSHIQSQPQSQTRQKPATDMDRLLRELRDLDSSQDRQGDHVVGEMYC